MTTYALIGADGAGKTTVGRRLEQLESPRVKYLYMGDNPAASNYSLPTTRFAYWLKRRLGKGGHEGGPPDPSRHSKRPAGFFRRLLSGIKGSLRLVNQLAEEWYRQCIAWYHERRGSIVIFDRHFYSDYWAHDISRGTCDAEPRKRSLRRRIHGFVLERLYPRPDMVILLDAPAEVLYERKREGTIELIEARRQEYIALGQVLPAFRVVDAAQDLDQVIEQVIELLEPARPDVPEPVNDVQSGEERTP